MTNKIAGSIAKIAWILLAAAFTLQLAGCAGGGAPQDPAGTGKVSTMEGYNSIYNPAHISSAEAWDMVNSNSGAVVLDVRSQASYLERHVSIAVNVAYEDAADYAKANIPDKSSVIICYCYCDDKGGAALSVRDLLTGLGYTSVYYTEPDVEWTYEGTSVDVNTNTDANANEIKEDDAVHRIISGADAKKLYESNDGAILLDVRNKDEYKAFHIDGSVLIPVSELKSRLSELPDKDAIIIVYCRSGMRSASAYDVLTADGYENVYDMQSVYNWPN